MTTAGLVALFVLGVTVLYVAGLRSLRDMRDGWWSDEFSEAMRASEACGARSEFVPVACEEPPGHPPPHLVLVDGDNAYSWWGATSWPRPVPSASPRLDPDVSAAGTRHLHSVPGVAL